MRALKWYQVHAWRLSQHGLSPRLNSQDVVGAVTRTAGIQAQVMSAAELALCTRVEGLSAFDTWLVIEPEQAVREVIRRYLRAYGPATPEDFARWCWDGGGKNEARRLFASMQEELEEVDVEGWRAVALRATTDTMQRLEPVETIHLLPLFDAYTIGTPRAREQLFDGAYKRLIFRPQGWVSAVILVNGSIQGVWQSITQRSQTVIKVNLFCSPTAAIHKGIEAEVERLGNFFKTKVVLEYEHLSSSGL